MIMQRKLRFLLQYKDSNGKERTLVYIDVGYWCTMGVITELFWNHQVNVWCCQWVHLWISNVYLLICLAAMTIHTCQQLELRTLSSLCFVPPPPKCMTHIRSRKVLWKVIGLNLRMGYNNFYWNTGTLIWGSVSSLTFLSFMVDVLLNICSWYLFAGLVYTNSRYLIKKKTSNVVTHPILKSN